MPTRTTVNGVTLLFTDPAGAATDSRDSAERAEDAAEAAEAYASMPYASRAVAEAAEPPEQVDRIEHLNGKAVLRYLRATSGTIALTTADGATWAADIAQPLTPEHHGAAADGVTDDSAALAAAMAASRPITLLAGRTYLIGDDLTLTVPLVVQAGALVSVASGKTLTISAPIIADDSQIIFTGSGTVTGTRFSGAGDVYARWFGCALNDSVNDSAAAVQKAVDLAQALGVYVTLPTAGQVRFESVVTFRQGWSTSAALRYHPLLRGRGCLIYTAVDDFTIKVVPECVLADVSNGYADSRIDISDLQFSGYFTDASRLDLPNGAAILIGKPGYSISPLGIGRVENITAQAFRRAPYRVVESRHLRFDRVLARDYTGGVQVIAQTAGSFVGDLHFFDCEFTGTDTADSLRPLLIRSNGAGPAVSEARGIFFTRCIWYGGGSLLQAANTARIQEVWFSNNQWDNSVTVPTTPTIGCDSQVERGIVEIHIDDTYFVGGFIAVRARGVSVSEGCTGVYVRNCRFSLNKNTVAPVILQNMAGAVIDGNAFFNNDGANCIYIQGGVKTSIIANNTVPLVSGTAVEPTNFIRADSAGNDGNVVTGNVVNVSGSLVSTEANLGTNRVVDNNLVL